MNEQDKKVVALKLTQAHLTGDHSVANSPHGTDGGASTKIGDGFYLHDAKLAGQPATTDYASPAKGRKPKLGKSGKTPNTVLIENQ